MARKGFLTPKTFFPKTGDVFINSEDEELPVRECVRANQWIDDKSGKRVRYALIVARHEEFGLIVETVHEQTDMEAWLQEYEQVHRAGKEYERTEKGTFVEP